MRVNSEPSQKSSRGRDIQFSGVRGLLAGAASTARAQGGCDGVLPRSLRHGSTTAPAPATQTTRATFCDLTGTVRQDPPAASAAAGQSDVRVLGGDLVEELTEGHVRIPPWWTRRGMGARRSGTGPKALVAGGHHRHAPVAGPAPTQRTARLRLRPSSSSRLAARCRARP